MGLKIGEIARRSGVAPSTIRYYVRQGLLPEPEKVNKSMAYYDEGCVEKIHAIRRLQERRYLPLSVIRNILRKMDKGMSLDEAESIEDAVFTPAQASSERLLDRTRFLEATGLTAEELNEASRIGILIPCLQERGRTLYNEEDVLFARNVLRKILALGGRLEDLGFYVDLGSRIVDHEMRLRKSAVKGKSAHDNVRITAEISRMADDLRGYILRRLFQRRVQAAIQKSLGQD
jgi:DNA-binding transcriptional MerR regulator